jgi:putative ABC transport system ATP-binding protein
MADRVIHFADGGIREVVVNTTKRTPAEIDW